MIDPGYAPARISRVIGGMAGGRIELVRLAEDPMIIWIVHPLARVDGCGGTGIDSIVVIHAAIDSMNLGRLPAVVCTGHRFGHEAASVPNLARMAADKVLLFERRTRLPHSPKVSQLAQLKPRTP